MVDPAVQQDQHVLRRQLMTDDDAVFTDVILAIDPRDIICDTVGDRNRILTRTHHHVVAVGTDLGAVGAQADLETQELIRLVVHYETRSSS